MLHLQKTSAKFPGSVRRTFEIPHPPLVPKGGVPRTKRVDVIPIFWPLALRMKTSSLVSAALVELQSSSVSAKLCGGMTHIEAAIVARERARPAIWPVLKWHA